MQNRIVIVEAAGRDFHNFNMCYREDAWCGGFRDKSLPAAGRPPLQEDGQKWLGSGDAVVFEFREHKAPVDGEGETGRRTGARS
jgi:hypothetical protein